MVKKTLMILAALSMTACCAPDASAEKATLDVVEPAHRQYVEADPSLTAEEKQRRFRLLDSWRTRVEAQIKAQGSK